MVADGSILDCVKTTSKQKNIESNGFRIVLEPPIKVSDRKSEKFRFCFDQFLGVFLEEVCPQDNYRLLPPMLGDGQPVDLFKLFLVVREKGGFGSVTKNGLWDLVAEESGLDTSVSSSAKLVYVEYLDALERWLERVVVEDKKCTESKLSDSGLSLSGRLMELGAELKVFLSDSKKRDGAYPHLDKLCKNDVIVVKSSEIEKCVNDEEPMHIDSTKRFLDFSEITKLCDDGEVECAVVDLDVDKNGSDVEVKCEVVDLDVDKNGFDVEVDKRSDSVDVTKCVGNSLDFNSVCHDEELKNARVVEMNGGRKCADSDEEKVVDLGVEEKKESLNCNERKAESSSRKRKQDSTWKMLSWVTGIAKDPCDYVVGSLPDKSKWKSSGNKELWKQVLSYREAAFLKRHVDSSSELSIGQKNQKMHPSMYDDRIGTSYNLRERFSCNKKTCQAGASSKSSSMGAQNGSCKGGTEIHDDKELLETTDSTAPNSVFDYNVEKQIPVGPGFQAELPEWTGVPSESDIKWLGTRVWPLQQVEHKFFIERDPIGKGRQDSCGCQVRGSVECVRFHVAEKRYRLKLELGSAFHNWKFVKMGEDVMLSWTDEEQKNFKNIVRSNPPSLEKRFWDQIFKYFSSKSREELVSYYYNIFLLQRRAHQNRSTPCNIDSDDDCESESGSVAHSYVHETMKSPSSIFHSPNKKHKKSR